MKILKKIRAHIESDGDFYKIQSEGLRIRIKNSPEIENDIIEVSAIYIGKSELEETENEGVLAVLGKIEKYQTGKMSEKESSKMVNKLKTIDGLSDIVAKIEKQEMLTADDIESLQSAQKNSKFVFNYDQMKGDMSDEYIIDEMDFRVLFPSEDYQTELQELSKQEKEESIRLEREAIARIMGTKPKRKTVVDYLKEKTKQMQANEAVVFSVEGLSSLPQANDIERVLDWGQSIHSSPNEQLDLEVLENDHNKRDVSYYASALKYLGLVFVDDRSLCLTYAGEQFFSHDRDAQKTIVLDILMKDDLVAAIFHTDRNLEELTEMFNSRGLSGETIGRRASCLLSWKKYLVS